MTVIASADLGNAIAGGVGSRVRSESVVQSIGAGTSEVISFTAADVFDTDSWHDHTAGAPGDTRFTVPTGQAGLYLISLNAEWAAASATDGYGSTILVDGAVVAAERAVYTLAENDVNNLAANSVSVALQLTAAQIVTVSCRNSGAADKAATVQITIVRIGPTV